MQWLQRCCAHSLQVFSQCVSAYYTLIIIIIIIIIIILILIQSNLFKRDLFRRDFALSGIVALLFGRPIQNCMDKRDSEICKRDFSKFLAGV